MVIRDSSANFAANNTDRELSCGCPIETSKYRFPVRVSIVRFVSRSKSRVSYLRCDGGKYKYNGRNDVARGSRA